MIIYKFRINKNYKIFELRNREGLNVWKRPIFKRRYENFLDNPKWWLAVPGLLDPWIDLSQKIKIIIIIYVFQPKLLGKKISNSPKLAESLPYLEKVSAFSSNFNVYKLSFCYENIWWYSFIIFWDMLSIKREIYILCSRQRGFLFSMEMN